MPSHCGNACACACTKIKYVNKDLELTEEEYRKVKAIIGELKSEKQEKLKKEENNKKIYEKIEPLERKIHELKKGLL